MKALALFMSLIAGPLLVAPMGCQCGTERPKDEPRKAVVLPTLRAPISMRSQILDNPGVEPRSVARYSPLAGHSIALTISSSVVLEELVDGKKSEPLTLPPISTGFDVSWRGGNTANLVATAHEATVEQGGTEEARSAADALTKRYQKFLAHRAIEISNTERGLIGTKPSSTGEEPTRLRELVGALAHLVVPLPEEPIGVGASWTIVRTVPRASTSIKQTVRYTLLSRDGEVLTVRIDGERHGERQALDVPGLPPGATAELVAFREAVSGELTLNLRSPVVMSGQLSRDDSVHTRASRGSAVLSDYFSESRSRITLRGTKATR